MGQIVDQQNISLGNELQFDTKHLAQGTYFLNGKGTYHFSKIVIKN